MNNFKAQIPDDTCKEPHTSRMRFGETSQVIERTSLPLSDRMLASFFFSVPNGSVLLDVQQQDGALVFWFYVQDVCNAQRFKKEFVLKFRNQISFDQSVEGRAAEHVKTIQLKDCPKVSSRTVHVFHLL